MDEVFTIDSAKEAIEKLETKFGKTNHQKKDELIRAKKAFKFLLSLNPNTTDIGFVYTYTDCFLTEGETLPIIPTPSLGNLGDVITVAEQGDGTYNYGLSSVAEIGGITSLNIETGLIGGASGTIPGQWDIGLKIPVVETSGGTHQTTYTKGDILYASAANTLAKLPIGTANQVLRVNATNLIPEYATVGGGTVTSVGISNTDGNINPTGGPITTSGNIDLELSSTPIVTALRINSTKNSSNPYFALTYPTSLTAYTWKVPVSDAAGNIASDGSGNLSINASGINNFILFQTSGGLTPTWTCPANVYKIRVILIGSGGGGGGGGGRGSGFCAAGSGGGSGSAIEAVIPVIPGRTYGINLSVGGTGGNYQTIGNNGTGTKTQFADLTVPTNQLTAWPGFGGQWGNQGSAILGGAPGGAPNITGTFNLSTNYIVYSGSYGDLSIYFNGAYTSSPKGGSIMPYGYGGSSQNMFSGTGSTLNGLNGTGYGAGGAGGIGGTATGTGLGGNGTDGAVMLYY